MGRFPASSSRNCVRPSIRSGSPYSANFLPCNALRIGDGIDQSAAFQFQLRRNRLAGQARNFHQELVGAGHAYRVIEATTSWPFLGDVLGVFSVQNSWNTIVALALQRIATSSLWCRRDTCGIRRRSGYSRFRRDRRGWCSPRPSGLKMRLISAHVADHEAVEAADEVDRSLGTRSSFGACLPCHPRSGQHALQRIVVAGDVAADEGRVCANGTSNSAGILPFSLAFLMKESRSSPITSAMQVVDTAIISGLYSL